MEQVLEMSLYRPKPTDLVAFLPFACNQLEAPFKLRILVETVEEYVKKSAADDKGKKSKRDKTPQTQTSAAGQYSVETEPAPAEQLVCDENEVLLRARCDPGGQPVELLFHRCPQVPRLLIKIIGLCIPYHEQLARIAVRWTPLDGAALYELAKYLPLSQLTEISLDDSPALHRNYHLLLEPASRLASLSLARCGLADEECAALAARLAHPLPASRTLACLALDANRIGDAGARALGDALRTNRALRHLSLAGNAITSVGAADIFRSLGPFPVSSDEIVSKRRRTIEHLKPRMDAYARCYAKLTESTEAAAVTNAGRGRTSHARRANAALPMLAKSSGINAVANRVAVLAAEPGALPPEPFDPGELVARGDATYCVGNFSLSSLNLAYNELDCTSARRLADVLAYQEGARRGGGLLRVVLEGNALPAACEGARAAEALLERALAAAGPSQPQPKPGRRSERPKFK